MKRIEMITIQTYSKEKKWSYEKEFKTLKFWEFPADVHDRRIELPKEAFNSVILGKYISSEDR